MRVAMLLLAICSSLALRCWLPPSAARPAAVHRCVPGKACLTQDEQELQRILAELDDDDDDDDDDIYTLTAAEQTLAAELEMSLKAEMALRAANEQSHLGAGEALPLCEPADAVVAAELLASTGAVRVGAALSGETAAALRKFVVAELKRATTEAARLLLARSAAEELGVEMDASAAVADESGGGRFSKVLAPEGGGESQLGASPANAARWDLRLPLDEPIVRNALWEMYGNESSAAHHAIVANGGGSGAELWELAALISSPGAVAQVVHADTVYSPAPILFTSFVALQPICRSLGPTYTPHNPPEPESCRVGLRCDCPCPCCPCPCYPGPCCPGWHCSGLLTASFTSPRQAVHPLYTRRRARTRCPERTR